MISNTFAANTIRLAKVTYVHPEGQKLEVMFLDTGDYGRDVQVMSPYAGTDFGFTSGIPSPEQEGHEPNKKTDPNERHIIAVVATLQGRHICLGFLFPQVTHMAFTREQDKNRLIERHTSDFYRTVNDAADMDMVHPGGAWMRMGLGPFPDILEGRDYDKRWKTKQGIPPLITLASPLGVLIAGGKETLVVGAMSASASLPSGISAPASLPVGISMPASLPSGISTPAGILALAETDPPPEDEEEVAIGQMTGRFPGVCGFRKSGSFFLKVRDAIMQVNTDGQPPPNTGSAASLGPVFQWLAGGSSLLIFWNRIVLSYGPRTSMVLDEDGITLSVGETLLRLTEAGIATTGDITTSGVHTDANGVHVNAANLGGIGAIEVGTF